MIICDIVYILSLFKTKYIIIYKKYIIIIIESCIFLSPDDNLSISSAEVLSNNVLLQLFSWVGIPDSIFIQILFETSQNFQCLHSNDLIVLFQSCFYVRDFKI